MPLVIDDAPLTVRALVDAAAGPVEVSLSEAAERRISGARAVVDRYAAGPAPIYGLNTGLGGNLAHRLAPDEIGPFQAQILAGRSVGTGAPLSEELSRAALLVRLLGVAQGAAGLSPGAVRLMLDMLGAGLAPVIASRGSIGAGDLVLGAQMGSVLTGRGEIWSAGARRPAAKALAEAGLAPVTLGPKDALSLANHSAVTVAMAAFAAVRAGKLMDVWQGVAALAGEGYAMNPAIFDARLHALRPASGQEDAAAWFRAAFAGSALTARSIQDALSFRTMAPVFGATRAALGALGREIEIELNAAADNPAIVDGPGGGEMLSSPNFHTPAIALALDTMAIALVHVATASAQRVVKLMAPQLSGLAKYLSPVGGASAGFMPVQKTVAALLGEARLKAMPASLDALPVSEMVEDVAPQTPLAARKLDEQLELLELLAAVEAMVAAQAVDLRGQPRLGVAGRVVHEAVRQSVPSLEEDRAVGPEIERIRDALLGPEVLAALPTCGPGRAPRR